MTPSKAVIPQAKSRRMEIPITSMIQSMVVIPLEGLRRRGMPITDIIANTVGIQWDV
jgi:hypothetical protein